MTDNTSGSAGPGPDPNPFSREGSVADESFGTEAGSGYPGADQFRPDQSGADQSGPGGHGSTPITADAPTGDAGHLEGRPAAPDAASPATPGEEGHGSGAAPDQQFGSPYGQQPSSSPYGPSAGVPYGSPNGYGQPGGNGYGQPSANGYDQHSYGQPGADAYGQPGANPYGQPAATPYGQPPASPYGQPSANPTYEQPPSYDQGAGSYDQSGYGYGYGQPDQGQAGYGVNPYQGAGYPAYGMAAQQHPQAVTALVTGILGVVICPPVGIAGLVTGKKVRDEIDSAPQRYTGRGFGTAGFVLGIISIAYLVLLLLLGVLGALSS